MPTNSALSTEESPHGPDSAKDPDLQKFRRQQYENAWRRNKYATDPVWRDKSLASGSVYRRNRCATDQEWRHHHLEIVKKDYRLKMGLKVRSSRRKTVSPPPAAEEYHIPAWLHEYPGSLVKHGALYPSASNDPNLGAHPRTRHLETWKEAQADMSSIVLHTTLESEISSEGHSTYVRLY